MAMYHSLLALTLRLTKAQGFSTAILYGTAIASVIIQLACRG